MAAAVVGELVLLAGQGLPLLARPVETGRHQQLQAHQ
jgi:hypothetical protein